MQTKQEIVSDSGPFTLTQLDSGCWVTDFFGQPLSADSEQNLKAKIIFLLSHSA